MSLAPVSDEVAAFAAAVGAIDRVVPVGGRTQWAIGGPPAADARLVTAPVGVVGYQPAEMTVRVNAGTTIAELNAVLARHGQMVPLDPADPAATVGGFLAVGASGPRRLRYGPARDLVLQMQFVAHDGTVVTAGGPTVKNVSGYDLCRLLVGSLGTLGITAEVILRCLPLPQTSRWLWGEVDPFALRESLYRPSSILWDGTTTWLLLEGHPDDVDAESERSGLAPCDDPPPLPAGARLSRRPGALADLRPGDGGGFVAEVGVGVVHQHDPAPPTAAANPELQRDLKQRFDPTGRLNPGRRV